MLVLTRKKEESVIIGEYIELTILEIKGDQVKIGIKAPKDINILRKEVYVEIREENRAALDSCRRVFNDMAEIIKKGNRP